MIEPNRGLGLRVIEEGFHRPEKAARPALGEGPPRVGQHVKVVANLVMPLPCAHHPGELSKMAAFGGTITEVVSPDHVVAEVFPSNDMVPVAFAEQTWLAQLRHEGGANHPWHLVSLMPEGAHIMPVARGQDEDGQRVLTLKIACLGSFADVRQALWTVSGGPTEFFTDDDTVLDLSLETADSRVEVLLCRIWEERAASLACQRLLLWGADAVLFCGPGSAETDRLVDEALAAQGRGDAPRMQYLAEGAEPGGGAASVVLQGESAMPGVKHLIKEMLGQLKSG